MSLGMQIPTDPRLFQFTSDQTRVAAGTIRLMNNLMKGNKDARTNPSEAIAPAGRSKSIRDAGNGIGAIIDLKA